MFSQFHDVTCFTCHFDLGTGRCDQTPQTATKGHSHTHPPSKPRDRTQLLGSHDLWHLQREEGGGLTRTQCDEQSSAPWRPEPSPSPSFAHTWCWMDPGSSEMFSFPRACSSSRSFGNISNLAQPRCLTLESHIAPPRPHYTQEDRAPEVYDFFKLVCVWSVAQSCLTLCNPMD